MSGSSRAQPPARRLARIGIWIGGVALAIGALDLLGVPAGDWIRGRPDDQGGEHRQLVISAWDVLFAVIVVSWVFGWTGGKALVQPSYRDAKVKSREIKARRKPA